MITKAVATLAAVVAFLAVHPAATETAGGKTGDLWQISQEISMDLPGGMAMPSQTSKVCRPKSEANEPPNMGKEDCKMDSMTRVGNRSDWQISCKDGSTGTGHVVYDRADHYNGGMSLTMSQGSMQMKFEGTRLGDCDPNDPSLMQNRGKQIEAQMKASQAQTAAMTAPLCADGAAKTTSSLFVGPMAYCKDPQQLKLFCSSLATEAGFDTVSGIAPAGGYGLVDSAKACGLDAKTLQQDLCTQAVASASYKFIGEHCSAESKALAEQECAGRKYTSITDENLRSFCVRYSQQALSEDTAQEAPEDPKKQATTKTKKLLKGLFGK